MAEFPASLSWLRREAQDPALTIEMVQRSIFEAPSRLGRQLGVKEPCPIIGIRHHDNHAFFSYAASPFVSGGDEPVMIAAIDGAGDDGSVTLYEARGGRVRTLHANLDAFDSLGLLYTLISATQGGWTPLSSEGRYMGAAAWGDGSRLTNPYYMRLRQILYFGPDGEVRLNRALANWQRRGWQAPYTRALTDILGPPIPRHRLWNPDAVLNVDEEDRSTATQARVDKAAALQLVFEDALVHVVGHFIRRTGSSRLVLTGGCALNCVANMRLLECFDEDWYSRHLGRRATRLHLWVPPVPGDAGTPIGAAYSFAMACGVPAGRPLAHAFHVGRAPELGSIRAALDGAGEVASLPLGDTAGEAGRERVADFLAFAIAHGAVIGIFQGRAETGPRALGHRSILADPRDAGALDTINKKVKYRERLRPLAPMLTMEAARRFFELSPGASDADFDAYSYMTLTARARPEALSAIPAVVHRDGTGRIQIVREKTDPFVHAYLRAMGRRAGVEASINTSLNVRGPIVQTPLQALDALKRSRGMDGVLFIAATGEAVVAWHDVVRLPKDGGARLRELLRAWQRDADVQPVEVPAIVRPPRSNGASGAGATTIPSLPPGPGRPAIAQLLSWAFRTARTMDECAERYGDAFTLRFPGYPPQVFFSHPEAIRDIFNGDPEVFRAGQSNRVLEPFVGSRSLLVLDGQAHVAERKLVLGALQAEHVHAFVDTIREVVCRRIATWPQKGPFAMLAELQAITLDVIVGTVLGVDDSPARVRLRARLEQFLSIGSSPIVFFPWFQVDLGPLSPWGRLVRLEAEIGASLAEEIDARRRGLVSGRDVLSSLISGRGENGRALTDEELRDEVVTLLVAGHETTATALAWAFQHLLRHTDALARVRDELARVIAGAPVTAGHLSRLPFLDSVVKETLRLTPVLPVFGRVLSSPATVGGRLLPGGVYVNPCPYLTHRRSDVWAEPLSFRPDRFLTVRPGPYEFFPFGGGVRRCVGASLATCEMKVVLAEVLSRFELSLLSGADNRISHRNITFAPRGGVRVVASPRPTRVPTGAAAAAGPVSYP
jgi:carbamoyltransferase